MSDSCELNVVLRNLHLAENNRDIRLLRSCTFEILHLSNHGCDISLALPTVVKLMAHTDVFIKRIAAELIASHANRYPEMVLLATNTLVQDCRDLNPVVQSLGLRTLAALAQSLPAIDVLHTAVSEGLADNKNGMVKRSAALACVGLHQVAPETVTETGLWDRLYSLLADSDAGTVAACLCGLERIFSGERGGVVISNKLAQYLISALPGYTLPVQRFVIQFLLKHSPRRREQVFDHLNDLDPHIRASSCIPAVLATLELFLHLADDIPKIKDKSYSVAWASLKVNIARDRNEELLTAVLDYLIATDFPTKVLAEEDYKIFFCREDDPSFLIRKKSCLLSKLITANNADNILTEFLIIVRSLDPTSLHEVLTNILSHVGQKSDVEDKFVAFVKQLLELDSETILETVVQILPNFSFYEEDQLNTLLPSIETHYKNIKSTSTEIALLHLLRLHGARFDSAPEILEHMIMEFEAKMEDFEKSTSHLDSALSNLAISSSDSHASLIQLRLSLLTALVYVGLERPAKIQHMLAGFMEKCIKDDNRTVRDRALFLYGLLHSRVKQKLVSLNGSES